VFIVFTSLSFDFVYVVFPREVISFALRNHDSVVCGSTAVLIDIVQFPSHKSRNKWIRPMTTTEQQQTAATVTAMTGSPRRRRSTFYIPLQATARPVLAVARLADSIPQSATHLQPHHKSAGGRALSASALALLQADHPPSHRPPSSPSSSRRSSPLAFIRRPSSRKLARSSSTIITTGGRWLSSKASVGPLRVNCGDSSSSLGDTSAVVQQANRSPPIIVIEGSPDEYYRRQRRRRRHGLGKPPNSTGEDENRSESDYDADNQLYDDDEDDGDDNRSGQLSPRRAPI